jgi:DNA invertase Pin-like site-specific DNA recombinase
MDEAVIYIRVSSDEQLKNLSLSTQERLCREYCETKGWHVAKLFVERGESAKTIDRPAFLEMLRYCHQKKNGVKYLVVYALNRFARNADDHIPIAAKLRQAGIKLRSVTEALDDSIVGRSMEVMLALFSEIDNRMRADRTVTGLKSAVETGRWPFSTPIGYLKVPGVDGRASRIIDPQRGPLLRLGFTQFANGLHTIKQILNELTAQGLRTVKGNKVPMQTFHGVLRNAFYAGWLTVPRWGVKQKGNHEPLVDQHTFDKVQAILDGRRPTATPRRRNRADFPLRRFARCGRCGSGMTGGLSTGRSRRYRYYQCSKHCPGMGIRGEVLEQRFLDVLAQLKANSAMVAVFRETVQEVSRNMQTHATALGISHKRRLVELEAQRQRLYDAHFARQTITEEAFMEQVAKVEAELATVRLASNDAQADELDIETMLDFVLDLFTNADGLWMKLPLDHRQQMQAVLFPNGIEVTEEGLVRTGVSSPIFNALGGETCEKTEVARLTVARWNQIVAWLRQIDQLRVSIMDQAVAA